MINFADKKRKYEVIIFLMFLCYYFYSIGNAYGFSICPDEFGYWTYAANMCGCDWSEVISLGLYYSYGYTLILFPIFALCKNMVIAYRIAITINFLMVVSTYYILNYLLERLIEKSELDKNNSTYIYAAVAVFYPSVLFFVRTTMVETFLMFMYVLTSFLMYKYIERHKISTLIFLIVSMIYLYFLHLRAVGVLIAGVLTIAVSFFSFKGSKKEYVKYILVVLVLGAVFMYAGMIIKNFSTSEVYSSLNEEYVQQNNYTGHLWKIRYIFTIDGLIDLLTSVAGKLLYSIVSSFTLVIWGMYGFVKNIVSKNTKTEIKIFSLYIVLATLAELGIASLSTMLPRRIDSVIYGRYHEFVFPILIGYGMIHIMKARRSFLITIAIIISAIPLVVVSNYVVVKNEITRYVYAMSVGMGYMTDTIGWEKENKIWCEYIFCVILTIIMLLIIELNKRKDKKIFLIYGLLVVELGLSVRAGFIGINSGSLGAYRDTFVLQKIEEIKEDEQDRRIVYISKGTDIYIECMQFMLRDEKINVYQEEEYQIDEIKSQLIDSDILLIYYEDNVDESILSEYKYSYIQGRFAVYYN